MATPRKRWFTLECSLYREPWPRDLKLTLTMLGMLMADRWAADKLTARQATTTHLSLGDLLTISGKETREEAMSLLRELSSLVSLKITELDNGFVRVVWPKLAKTQSWDSRQRGSGQGTGEPYEGPEKTPGRAPPHPHPHTHTHMEEDPPNPPEKVDVLDTVWPEVQDAFAAYGQTLPKLTKKRRETAGARLRDHPEELATILAEAVHGRMRQHQRGDYDPREHLTPESLFAPTKFWRDVEACRAATDRGESPPFPYIGPQKRLAERSHTERAKDIAEGRYL